MSDQVLVVGGGHLQVPIIAAAHKLGLEVVMTDKSSKAPAMRLADLPIALDTKDVASHVNLAKQLVSLRGVFTAGADVEVTVAHAAASRGLPGISIEAARACNNKAVMRKRLDEAGIPGPRWKEVIFYPELFDAANQIGYPLMVKATDNCASRGVFKVSKIGDLQEALLGAGRASTTSSALFEECLVGSEHSVEILFDTWGKPMPLNIVDRLFTYRDTHPIEDGHINPSLLSKDDQAELFALTIAAAKAVGVGFGAFKADCIWTRRGPMILEVTARLSGGYDCQHTTPLATGRDFILAALALAVGRPIPDDALKRKQERFAVAIGLFATPGTIREFKGVEEAKALPGVDHIYMHCTEGDKVRQTTDCAARLGFVIASGETANIASLRAFAARDTIEIISK